MKALLSGATVGERIGGLRLAGAAMAVAGVATAPVGPAALRLRRPQST